MEIIAENGIISIDGLQVEFKAVLEAVLKDEKCLMTLREFVDAHEEVEFMLR